MPTKRDDILAVFVLWLGRPNLQYEALEREAQASSEIAVLQSDVLPEEAGTDYENSIDNNPSETLLI